MRLLGHKDKEALVSYQVLISKISPKKGKSRKRGIVISATTMSTTGRFMIQLENNGPAIFSPGQLVNATVVYCTTNKETYTSLYLKIKGIGYVSWDTGSGDDKSNFSDKETYIDFKIPFEGNLKEHEPGRNLFHFTFTLPYGIPSSYEYRRGYVRYTLKAVMKRSVLKRDLFAKIPFVMDDGIVDLNQNEAALIAPKNTVSKLKTLLSPGTTQVDTLCDRSGFIPGETIKLDLKIVCSGGRVLRSYEVRLTQYITFIAKTSRNKMTKVLWKHKETRISNTGVHSSKILVMIPKNIPLSGKLHCNLIEIDYAVEVIVDSGFFAKNLVSSFKILIGNVPLIVRSTTNNVNEVIGSTRPSIQVSRDDGAALSAFNNHERQLESRQSVQFHDMVEATNVVTSIALPVVTVTRTEEDSPPPTYESCVEKNGFRFDNGTNL